MSDARASGLTTRAVMQRWAKHHDTWMISKHFGVSEAEVSRIVSAEQDRKHRVRTGASRHREHLRVLRQTFSATPF
jgi:hypothetical protein